MATGKSIGSLNAKVTADASQFVSEFARADNASRRAATAIDKEVDKLTKGIKKKFSVSDFGKDLLKGFGIGSGFAVAEKAGEMIVNYWKQAAEHAQEVERATAGQLEATLKLISLNQTDEQRLQSAQKELARKQREYEQAMAPKTGTEWITKREAGGGMIITGTKQVTRNFTEEEKAQAANLLKIWQEYAVEVATLQKQLDEKRAQSSTKAAKTAAADAMQTYKDEEDLRRKIADAITRQDAEMDKLAETFKEAADPTLQFKKQMADVQLVLDAGKISAKEAAGAIASIQRAMEEAEAQRVDKALDKFFGPLDQAQKDLDQSAKKTTKAGMEIGWAFSSAFEDAILSGKKLGDVLEGLGQDILRIAIRTAITAPIGEAIGGMFLGGAKALFGKPAAEGGFRDGSKPYLVGEEGPEIFNPGTSGTITPTDRISAGGNTYVIDARGADAGVVDRLAGALRALAGPGVVEKRALTAISSARRRGFAY